MLAVAPALLFTAMKLRTSVFPASWDAQQKAGDVANVVEEDVTGVRVVKGFGQEAPRARSADRSLARDVRVTRAAREHPGAPAARDADDPRVRSGRGARARRLARAPRRHHARHVPRVLHVHAADHAADPAARRDPHRRPARPGRRRAHLRPARLDAGRAGRARRDRSRGTERRGALRPRDVRLHVDRAGAARLRSHGRRRRDGRARRQLGIGQVDRRADAAALLRRALGRDHDRRHRRARRPPRLAAPQHRRGVRGLVPLLRLDHRQHRLRPARRDASRRSRPRRARPRRTSSSSGCPHGYDTVVGEQGLTLSGGQRQRVALARALLSDPKILLLDDATSSVDSRVEEEIHATLRRIASTRTTILIAHRRSSLSLADRIVVVDHGAVLDAGTHDELWARCDALPPAALRSGRRRRRSRSGRRRRPTSEQVDGITPSAWRGLDDEEIRSAQIAERTRTSSPSAAVRVGGGGGFGGGGGGGGAWGGALAPTPELLAQVDALGPATADPHVDVAFESKASPDFKFLHFLHRYRGWLLVGLALVTLDSVCTLVRSAPRAVRHRQRRRTRSDTSALWAASIVFLRRHALRLVGDVGRAARDGPRLGTHAARAAASRCSPISSGSASTTTSTRWRAGS